MFVDDISAFFNTTEFAQRITLGGVEVVAIFDNAYAQGGVGVLGMASSQPALTLPTANVPAQPQGLAVVVGSTNYLVASHEPDGTGISVLMLEVA